MQSTQTPTKTASTMPFNKNKDSLIVEDSELDDLQAMASSAKRRRSQRLSSQMDAQDSLLQSNAVLDAVVLPDPSKQAAVSIAEVAAPATAVAKESAVKPVVAAAEPQQGPASSNKGLYVGLGLLVVGAAAAFLLLGGDTKADEQATSEAVAAAVVDDAVVDDELPPAIEMAPALALEEDAKEAVVEPAADTVEEVVEEAAPKKKTDVGVEKNAKTPKNAKEKVPRLAVEPKTKPSKPGPAKPGPAKPDPAKPDPAKKSGKSSSLDDVLSSVTGGVDKPIAKQEDERPSKKTLGRGDVAKAMKKITPAAKSCYSAEEFSGMVKVKYSVAPDGSISKASATGAHKDSKTGKCVVRAVRKAKFPAFSGATMSFSFPFLLSP